MRSELEFPELSAARECLTPDWTLRIEPNAPQPIDCVLTGEKRLGEERYRLYRGAEGFRLEYSHAGTFDISVDGARIVWYYDESVVLELARSIVLGPAIALALELSGSLCLHGSAVTICGRAVAFVGPKYFGKSTLATALTAAGGQLIGDDLLVVSPTPPATVRPGVASVRLWPDIVTTLPLMHVCDTLIPGVKTTATGFMAEALAQSQSLLGAIYVLTPFTPTDAELRPAWRTRLAATEATIALAHQTKLPDSLIGLHGAGAQLSMAASVATQIPVSRLHIVRDVARLDEVVRLIIEWSSDA